MASPVVSVVVPVYNGERFLGAALESIFGQGYELLEVVVVDDGSTDRTADIATAFPVQLVELEHGGIARARNAGVEAATGELIGFLDADDVFTPGTLRPRVEYLWARPMVDLTLARMEFFLEPGTPRPPFYLDAWERDSQPAFLGGLLARRKVFDVVGLFDPSYVIGEDTDWLARVKDSDLTVEHVNDVVMRYRYHGANSVYQRELVGPGLMRILRASIERQREQERANG